MVVVLDVGAPFLVKMVLTSLTMVLVLVPFETMVQTSLPDNGGGNTCAFVEKGTDFPYDGSGTSGRKLLLTSPFQQVPLLLLLVSTLPILPVIIINNPIAQTVCESFDVILPPQCWRSALPTLCVNLLM